MKILKTKPACAKADSPKLKMKWTNILKEPEPPMSAYNLFFQEERARLLGVKCDLTLRRSKKKSKQQVIPHGVISFQDLSKHVGKTWRALSKAERKKYTDIYEATKKQYKEETEAYLKAVSDALDRAQRKRDRLCMYAKVEINNREIPDTISCNMHKDKTDDYNFLDPTAEEFQIHDCVSSPISLPQEDFASIEPMHLDGMADDQRRDVSHLDIQIISNTLNDLITSVEDMKKKPMSELEADLYYILEEFQMDVPEPLFYF